MIVNETADGVHLITKIAHLNEMIVNETADGVHLITKSAHLNEMIVNETADGVHLITKRSFNPFTLSDSQCTTVTQSVTQENAVTYWICFESQATEGLGIELRVVFFAVVSRYQ